MLLSLFPAYIQDLSSPFLSPVTMPCDYARPHALAPASILSQLLLTLTLWKHSPNTLFIIYVIVLMVFYHCNRKTTTASVLWHKTGYIISIVCTCFVFMMRYKWMLVLFNNGPEHIHLMHQPAEHSPNSFCSLTLLKSKGSLLYGLGIRLYRYLIIGSKWTKYRFSNEFVVLRDRQEQMIG